MDMSDHVNRLAALAHPQRLGIFRLLVRRYPDAVPAGELAAALGVRQNTLSAYLSSLRHAGLIEQTRAGRSLLYRIDMETAGGLMAFLAGDCCQGRPELCGPLATTEGAAMPDRKLHVLFICTGNSARSIMAEALLRRIGGDRFVAHSAGILPASELNPIAVEMLRDKGHDVAFLRAKTLNEFRTPDAPAPDFVFTVCDHAANEECPPWPGQPVSAHWGMPDPVKATGTEAERRLAFQQAYAGLKNRITTFAALPFDSLDRASLQARLDDIARDKEPA